MAIRGCCSTTQLGAEEKTGGLYVRSIPSIEIERRYAAVDWAFWLAPSPDGHYAAVTTRDEVRVLDLAGVVQERIKARTDEVIVADGTIVAMKGVRVWALRGDGFRGGELPRTVWLMGGVG